MVAKPLVEQICTQSAALSIDERLAPFVVAKVRDPKSLRDIMGILSTKLPMPLSLSHIKRVKRIAPNAHEISNTTESSKSHQVAVLLCTKYDFLEAGGSVDGTHISTDLDCSCQKETLDTKKPGILPTIRSILPFVDKLEIEMIPAIPNGSREEFHHESNTIWPMAWIPKQKSSVTNADTPCIDVTKDLEDYFIKGMKLASTKAQEGKAGGFQPSACVILKRTRTPRDDRDGVAFEIMAAEFSRSRYLESALESQKPRLPTHPLHSAAFLAVEIVAERDRTAPGSDTTALSMVGNRYEDLLASSDENISTPLINVDPALIESVSSIHDDPKKRQLPPRRSDAPYSRKSRRTDSDTSHRHELPEEEERCESPSIVDTTEYDQLVPSYLCTGYDAFLTHEPTLFDAMVLLHSRINTIIYAIPDHDNGAVEGLMGSTNTKRSPLRLHELHGINHRYTVFRLHGITSDNLFDEMEGSKA